MTCTRAAHDLHARTTLLEPSILTCHTITLSNGTTRTEESVPTESLMRGTGRRVAVGHSEKKKFVAVGHPKKKFVDVGHPKKNLWLWGFGRKIKCVKQPPRHTRFGSARIRTRRVTRPAHRARHAKQRKADVRNRARKDGALPAREEVS